MRNVILTLALAGAATPLLAQTPPAPLPGGPMRGGMLMRADANNDGVVTREEMIAAANAQFDRLDADRDGKVTRDEMRAAREAMRGGGDRPPAP
jgi:hypothetical protein